jgi:DNA-binding SARP family transcriptional activator
VSDSNAFSSLRSAVARLPLRGEGLVAAGHLELGLREGVSVDLADGRALAARLIDQQMGCLPLDVGLGAVEVLSAELLPGWYDDWVLIEAEDWRQLRLHALEALAVRLAAAGRFSEAAGAARAAVRIEPLRETSRAALIRVHIAEGNQSEAVREFSRYAALLRAELGLEPTPRLRLLVPGLDCNAAVMADM